MVTMVTNVTGHVPIAAEMQHAPSMVIVLMAADQVISSQNVTLIALSVVQEVVLTILENVTSLPVHVNMVANPVTMVARA